MDEFAFCDERTQLSTLVAANLKNARSQWNEGVGTAWNGFPLHQDSMAGEAGLKGPAGTLKHAPRAEYVTTGW
jgi:hypothetical protein